MSKNKDTIFALSTATGRSAIALIRISGSTAINSISKISSNMPKKSKTSELNKIFNKKNEPIDQTITTIYKKPKSYTGEDMVELSLHGGQATINKIIKKLNSISGFRLAEPGEFTRRAFENNKLDVAQVEAIADLVNSETEAQRKQSLSHLSGLFSSKINKWTKKILKTLADTEAAIDFSDEDLPKNLIKNTKEQIKNIIKEIEFFLKDKNIGEKIRSGFIIGILGSPNAGKSSFVNNIAKRELAIVTDIPGTTRDVLELYTDLSGLPVRFFDTAGIRKSKNTIEEIGVKKSIEISKISDLNLVFLNKESDMGLFKTTKNKIFVQSKIDKNKRISTKNKIHYISSTNNKGIDLLLKSIYNKLKPKKIGNINVSRERHRKILEKTKYLLKYSLKPKNIDMFAEDLRLSLYEISKITGKKDVEDVLEMIFSDFCIGK